MTDEQQKNERRAGVQTLAALTLLDDGDGMERFRKQRLREAKHLADDELVAIREITNMLVDTLLGQERQSWEWLHLAWEEHIREKSSPQEAAVEESDSSLEIRASAKPGTPMPPPRIDQPVVDDHDRPAPLAASTPPAPSPWTRFTDAAALASAAPPASTRGTAAVESADLTVSNATNGQVSPPPSPNASPTDRPPPMDMRTTKAALPFVLPGSLTTEPDPASREPPGVVLGPSVSSASYPAPASPPPSSRARAQTRELSCTSGAHGLTLSLREYAALSAECEAFPDHTRAICDRYDVHDEPVMKALERLFQLRFQGSPWLRSQFEQQRARFLHRLRQG